MGAVTERLAEIANDPLDLGLRVAGEIAGGVGGNRDPMGYWVDTLKDEDVLVVVVVCRFGVVEAARDDDPLRR
jgi:hypothetical protein